MKFKSKRHIVFQRFLIALLLSLGISFVGYAQPTASLDSMPKPSSLSSLEIAMEARTHYVLWVSPDGDRYEHLRLVENENGFEADGLILRKGDEADVRMSYRIRGDANWRVRSVRVESLNPDHVSLSLTSDGNGHWRTEEGVPVRELDGCFDVDLQASPFTNTIAIRRLSLDPEESEEIDVVFMSIPDLEASPVQQRYTRLVRDGESDTYRYEGLDSGFTSELPVDPDGLLMEYPGYFRRVWKH